MTWALIRAEARRTGTVRQRALQRILDQANKLARKYKKPAALIGLYKKAMKLMKVRHNYLRMDRGLGGTYSGYMFGRGFNSRKGLVTRKTTGSYPSVGRIRKPGTYKPKPLLDPRRVKKRSQGKRKRTSTKKQGSFKKAKKIRTAPSKFAKRHYDDYGSLERDHCAYIGFQRHGCKDRMWSILGEAMSKAMLAKIKFYPRAYDEPMEAITMVDRLYVIFKRVAVPGGAEEEITPPPVQFDHTTTFEQFASQVTDMLKDYAERDDDNDQHYAYYPFRASFENSNSDDNYRVLMQDLGESIVELYATQVITVKNLTPNDGGTSELDVVGVNPIHGKKYEFNNFRPKLIDTIERDNAFLGAFYEVDDTTGINTALTIPGELNRDNIIAHPPVPRQLFTNCARAASISMGAGGVKTERTTFKLKHKLSTLIERIYYNQYDKGSFGGCTFFAFERKTRSVTGESRVKISFDRALHMSAHCKLAVKKTMLKHYDNNPIGPIFDPVPE